MRTEVSVDCLKVVLFYRIYIKISEHHEKKQQGKALKPSEMGLHSKVRCSVKVIGDTPKEQGRNIALFAEELYLFIYRYNHGTEPETVVVTQKFARFVSKIFNFSGFSDDEVFRFIDRLNDTIRKQQV